MPSDKRDVILYELNEVPWGVVDLYLRKRHNSNLAAMIDNGQSLTTIHEDKEELGGLQPWRTWPTFHTSTYEHNSFDLGQDPTTFRAETVWDVAEQAGLSVGLFGPLQSWPARDFKHGGFFVPDTFSKDAKTYPTSLERFQAFNLAMTSENNFSPDTAFGPKMIVGTGVDLLRQGLTPKSAGTLVAHLTRERTDQRYKAFRSAMQVLPGFDLYWRLQQKHQPRLSVFFTNHVAGMMHRFWGDGMPGYTDTHEYTADDVYGSFIVSAMDIVDRQLARIRKYMAAHPQTVLVLAASMGQGPIDYTQIDQGLFVLEHHNQLVSRLKLPKNELGLAMYPMLSLIFDDEADAQAAVAPLQSVRAEGFGAIFTRFRVEGKTVTFGIDYNVGADDSEFGGSTSLTFRPLGADEDVTILPAELGLEFRHRVGGGNTGYHIPEGILMAYGKGISRDVSRKEVDVLDVSPSLLANILDVEPGTAMKGVPSLFA
jgi:hypothetical protein